MRPATAATPSSRQRRQSSFASKRPTWIWFGYFGSISSGTLPTEK